MSMSCRIRSRHHSERIKQNVLEKLIRETIKILRSLQGSCKSCGLIKSQNGTNQMTTGSDFREGGKWKHGYCSRLQHGEL